MQLRPYQVNAIDKVREAYRQGAKSLILRLDCGSGKTCIAAKMCIDATKKGNKVLFLVHRKELLDQTYATFKMFDADMTNIDIGMILTVGHHLDKYNPDFIIADECNFSLARTWKKVLNNYPNAWILGLSATPVRLDGKPLGELYEKIIDGVEADWLIDNGYLAEYDYYAPPVLNMEWKMKGIDYDLSDVTASLLKSKIYGKIEQYIDKTKKTIIYSPSIEFSKSLCERIGATHFDGNTPKKERDKIVTDFKSGKIMILSNVDLISFGFDVPDCDCVILLRPTMSLSLYIQQSMRCLRPGKKATIYDLVGNVYRHGMPTEKRTWSLVKRISRKRNTEADVLVRQCQKCRLVYSGHDRLCPYCGNDNGQTRRQIEEEEKLELVKIKKLERRKVGMASTFEELVKIGNARGYKNAKYWARMVLSNRKRRI